MSLPFECVNFESKKDFSKHDNFPEDSRFKPNLIGICIQRCNLAVNEVFCRACKKIDWPCISCNSKLTLRRRNYIYQIYCENCNRVYSTNESKNRRNDYLNKNNIVY